RVLRFLIDNRHRVVSKEEIHTAVWDSVAVSDGALTRAITQIRKALEDDSKQPRYIETVPTVGYRFIAEVVEDAPPPLRPGAPTEMPGSQGNRRWFIASALTLAAVAGGVGRWWGKVPPSLRVSGLRRVTQSAAADLWPSFSPDSSQIVFSSNRSGR